MNQNNPIKKEYNDLEQALQEKKILQTQVDEIVRQKTDLEENLEESSSNISKLESHNARYHQREMTLNSKLETLKEQANQRETVLKSKFKVSKDWISSL